MPRRKSRVERPYRVGKRRGGSYVRQGKERQMSEASFKWLAAVDWGSEKHQVCVLDAEGGVKGEREFRHSGAGLTQLADWVQSITGPPSTVAIAIEVPHGPVVDVLLDRGFCVYSINPK